MTCLPKMWMIVILILSICGLGSCRCSFATGTTYFLSQSEGDDSYDGLSKTRDATHGPWKTLAKASAVQYQSGDQLLLKCGEVWNETLLLHGNGTAENPIKISSYGTGERPSIQRTRGNSTACIIIDKGCGYCLKDLDLGVAQNAIRLMVDSRVNPAPDYFLIENCFFHDTSNPAYPDLAQGQGYAHNDQRYMGWAIFTDGFDSPEQVRLTNLTVRNCFAVWTQGFFIHLGPIFLENISFDGNTSAHCSYNGIYQSNTKHYDIVNSVFVYGYPWEFHPYGATQVIAGNVIGDATVRNEVKNNEFGWAGDYPRCGDGCAYDFETPTGGVTFQNNFVHDTFGEAVLFMAGCKHNDLLFDGNIFRNNVRFSPRWDVEVNVYPDNTGNGTFSNNVFSPRQGKRVFNSKPSCFQFINNDENCTRQFVEMPLVTGITYGSDQRTYTLSCKTPGSTIHYTLDGSLPTLDSAAYSGPITVNRSGVVNAKAFKMDCYPSPTNSLLVDLRDSQAPAPSAWWKLDEESGVVVTDSSGGNPGILKEGVWTDGKLKNGLEMNGNTGEVVINHENLKTIADAFTIAFWTCPSATSTFTTEANNGVGSMIYAWWKLDESSGTTISDTANGTFDSLKGCTWTEGKKNTALQFNGTSDSVALVSNSLCLISDTFTVSFWANPEATRAITPETDSGTQGVSGQRYALAANQYSAITGEAGLGVSLGTNGISVFELADNYLPSLLVADRPLTGWHLITLVYRDKQPSVYIDGVFVKTGLRSSKKVHPSFNLGGGIYGWYQGKLDDIRVYPRALENTEIQQLATEEQEALVAWTLPGSEKTGISRNALLPISRGAGDGPTHAGVGVSVGTNGISVVESSDDYLPSLLVDNCSLSGWNHVTVVYKDKQPTLYLNGVYEKAGFKSRKTVHPVFNLGGSNGSCYAGRLDDIRVYNRALGDAEIQVLASGGE